MAELQSVLRHILWQMENADTVSISQQSMKQTIEDDIETQELSIDIESKLDDEMRIQIATELKTKIEKKI